MAASDSATARIRRSARWILRESREQASAILQRELGLERVAAAVLASRGYDDPIAAQEFLSPKLDGLHNPALMQGMGRAVERLREAVAKQEQILLYGDYDVDGTCSIVLLKKAIELLGGLADFHIPHRLQDGYGMRNEVIERASETGVRLIVSVDTGIRANEVVRRANSLGMDVIVTDHHLPEAELPPAFAVLNPNRRDCDYPNKHLCGAGVTFKFVQALLAASDLPDGRQAALLDSFLKPVAIATVADVVPLTGENRLIVQRGLAGLSQVRNVGMRALMTVAGFDDGECPSAHQVAFRLAPRINAAGRMATARDVIELFLTSDSDRARFLAEQLDVLNRERQQAEAEIVEQILKQCEESPFHPDCAGLVFAGSGWHLGVLGIVASRLVERFSRPVFVLSDASHNGDYSEPHVSGSGRSIPAFHLLEALECMSDLFTKFGGHRQAAGITLRAAALDDFQHRFDAFAQSKLTMDDLCPQHTVDTAADFSELTERCIRQILSLGPFGFGNPTPIFLCENAEVAGPVKVLKEGKHFSVPLRKEGRLLFCKAWNFDERSDIFQPGAKLDILFHVEDDPMSRKRGYGSWQLSLKDVRAAQPPV